MANEVTPSVVSTHSLSYVLAQRIAPPNKASVVLSPLCSSIDNTGKPSLVEQIANPKDIAAASAATYGTAISQASNTDLGYDSAFQVTLTEGAARIATILDAAVEVEFPGMESVDRLMQEGSFDQKLGMIQPYVNRLADSCLEKFESDHCALTSGFSNSAGTSTAALTVADIFSAKFTFDTFEAINQDAALLLWASQIRDLRSDLAVSGGGLGGSIWVNADASMVQLRGIPANGLIGSILGIPVYQGSHSLRTLSDANANVNGALFARGQGDPNQTGVYGAICNAVRYGAGGSPFVVRMRPSPEDRGHIVTVTMTYGVAEFRDTLGVRIRSRAA